MTAAQPHSKDLQATDSGAPEEPAAVSAVQQEASGAAAAKGRRAKRKQPDPPPEPPRNADVAESGHRAADSAPAQAVSLKPAEGLSASWDIIQVLLDTDNSTNIFV